MSEIHHEALITHESLTSRKPTAQMICSFASDGRASHWSPGVPAAAIMGFVNGFVNGMGARRCGVGSMQKWGQIGLVDGFAR